MSEPLSPTSIVVAVDASPGADRAVRWAARQARLERRPLVVVCAAEVDRLSSADWAEALTGSHDRLRQALLDDARRTAERAAAVVRVADPDVTVRAAALDGDARAVVVGLSSRVHLLVLGSRGRGNVRSMLLGSVSADVAK